MTCDEDHHALKSRNEPTSFSKSRFAYLLPESVGTSFVHTLYFFASFVADKNQSIKVTRSQYTSQLRPAQVWLGRIVATTHAALIMLYIIIRHYTPP